MPIIDLRYNNFSSSGSGGSGTFTTEKFLNFTGQQIITTEPFNIGFIELFVNGVRLIYTEDYSTPNTSTIDLTSSVASADIVVVKYGSGVVTTAVTSVNGQAGAVVIPENFSYNNIVQNIEIPVNQQMIVSGSLTIQDNTSLTLNGSLAII